MHNFPLKSASNRTRLKMFTFSVTFKSLGTEVFALVAHCYLPVSIASFKVTHALQLISPVAHERVSFYFEPSNSALSLCHFAMLFAAYILALSFSIVTAIRGVVYTYLFVVILCSLFVSCQ